jgi:hypothetical protein
MKKIIVLFLAYLSLGCSSKKIFQKQIVKMEKFDLRNFEKRAVNNEVNDTLNDGTSVKMLRYSDSFAVETRAQNDPFKYYKIYYSESSGLKLSGREFYTFKVGTWDEYDRDENLIAQKNWDAHYLFSIDDLSVMMKNQFEIDLMQTNQGIGVIRGFGGKYYYEVYIPLFVGGKSPHRVIRVDGNTGKIISDLTKNYRE